MLGPGAGAGAGGRSGPGSGGVGEGLGTGGAGSGRGGSGAGAADRGPTGCSAYPRRGRRNRVTRTFPGYPPAMSDALTSESSPRIDWETAEVSDGELRVELAGELPKGWGKRFTAVLDRLGAQGGEARWAPPRVRKGAIVVAGVGEGCEADLRHQLESAVLQANADLDVGADAGAQLAGESPEAERDARMTGAFRGFADAG
jgi:hypothetical protein